MDRLLGVDATLLDLPLNAAQTRLVAEVATAINQQEPRARLKGIRFTGDGAQGLLGASVTVEIVTKNLRGGG